MIRVLPSILEPTKQRFTARYRLAARFCQMAQLDVLDNTFLPYRNFHDPRFINSLKPGLPFEVHFMVNNVERQLVHWAYPWVKKIIFHFEAVADPMSLITAIKRLRIRAGIAINPETPAQAVYPFLGDVDTILAMTVHPGRNGAAFQVAVIAKIKRLRRRSRSVNIEVDGGITPDTGQKCLQAGANLFVVGSYLKNEEFQERLRILRQSLR